MDWKQEFPKEEGYYWFYGYRHGKKSYSKDNKPELMLIKVRKIQNGFMYVGNGQFVYESEVECPHFKKADLPELPKLEE